jgi:tripartite-type tricarboxylate transporter receptor subunit TctC
MRHVPYKGASIAVADVVAGHIDSISTTLTTAGTQIRAARLRGLAVSSAERVGEYSQVPTFRELGYPQLVATVWFSISGPAGIPVDIVTRLNSEIRRALQSPEIRDRLRVEGIHAGTLDPKAFHAFVAAEIERWAPVVRGSGARAD